jgi:hypothetical protein
MENSTTVSMFNLPTHTITAEELRRSMPKATWSKRIARK